MSLRVAAVSLTVALLASACAGGDASPVAGGVASDPDQVVAPTAPAAGSAGGEEAEAGEAGEAGDAGDAGDAGEAGDAGAASVESLWWSADTVDGGELVAADLAGGNVVLWLWAPWCTVCNREAPEVAEALADLPDDVTLVGVAGRDEVGPMQEFVAEHDLGAVTHVVDADGAIWASYGISYQPAWVFIDAEGGTRVTAGALGYDGLFDGIDEVFRS